MAEVEFRGVAKRFGSVSVIEDLNLAIRDREFMVLVGPSGCGKSTALRLLAGLEEVSAGTIAIGGRPVNDLPPKDRDIAMVFQTYALYPHLSVRENLEFGLRMRQTPAAEMASRVREAAQVLDIATLLERKPKELSGGQRQRVALGRAIVRHPAVFLFDEPLSNLDAKLRVQMRGELTRLQQRLATTSIYVTHDQVEAMTMGHRIAVMRAGRLEQVGTALEVYERPATLFVAGFIGTPPMNLITATVADGGATLAAGELRLPVPAALCAATRGKDGQRVVAGIRPEHLTAQAAESGGVPACRLTMAVELVELLGHEAIVHGRIGDAALVAKTDPHRAPAVGGRLDVAVDLARLHLFDAASDRRLG
jgi:multiple sugar transport system ATP-binding protein